MAFKTIHRWNDNYRVYILYKLRIYILRLCVYSYISISNYYVSTEAHHVMYWWFFIVTSNIIYIIDVQQITTYMSICIYRQWKQTHCKSKHRPFREKKKKIAKKLLQQSCIFAPPNVIDLCRQWWRGGNVRCCKRLVIGPFVGRFIFTWE